MDGPRQQVRPCGGQPTQFDEGGAQILKIRRQLFRRGRVIRNDLPFSNVEVFRDCGRPHQAGTPWTLHEDRNQLAVTRESPWCIPAHRQCCTNGSRCMNYPCSRKGEFTPVEARAGLGHRSLDDRRPSTRPATAYPANPAHHDWRVRHLRHLPFRHLANWAVTVALWMPSTLG